MGLIEALQEYPGATEISLPTAVYATRDESELKAASILIHRAAPDSVACPDCCFRSVRRILVPWTQIPPMLVRAKSQPPPNCEFEISTNPQPPAKREREAK